MSEAKIALLSTLGSVLTVPMLNALREKARLPSAIIIDGSLDTRARRIVEARLDRAFEQRDLYEIDLPDVPTYFVKNHNSSTTVELVKKLGIDYLINAGTPRILKPALIDSCRGILNCHPGLLPKYRGCTAVEWSLFYGDPVGATTHFLTAAIDEGPIIRSEQMTIARFESYESIRTRMIGFQAEVMAVGVDQVCGKVLRASDLPIQCEGSYFQPIPLENLISLKAKLARGDYQSP